MKKKEIFLIVAALAQPMIWWFVYTMLEAFASKHGTNLGLQMACTFTCIFSITVLAITAKNLYE